jgi:hypothetical protein
VLLSTPEAGGEDKERGVHAVPAVSGSVPVRHVVVRLRPARTRPLRHGNFYKLLLKNQIL